MTLFRPAETRDAVATGSPAYNPFENPSVPLAAVGLDNVYGRSNNDAGQTVTPDTAAGVATFFRCISLLSTVVAGCPIEVYRKRDQEIVDNALFDAANSQTTYTPFEYMQLVMVYRLVWGNSFVFKKRDDYDQIIDLKPLFPGLVEVNVDRDNGDKVFLVKRLKPDGTIDQDKPPLVYTDWEIMHVPGLGFDGLKGLPVVDLMSQTLGTAIAADKLAARFYSSGSQLGGIIKVKAPLRSQTQAEGIKSRWMANNAGVAHAGDVAVLDAETDFQNITIPPDQLQFLESRRWQTTEIARWFGVPPHLVGDVEKSTSWGTGIEVQNVGLSTYTVRGHTDPIEQRHTREVVQVRGQYARFNLDDLMRGSMQERYQALSVAVGGPWMARNEARKAEGRKPLEDPEYDELLPPQGIGPMDSQDAGPTQPAPQAGKQSPADEPKRSELRDAAGKAYEQEARDYPPSAMAWMHEAAWKGPVDVPAGHIDPDMSRMDKADPDHVDDFVRKVKDGKRLKPVILVKLPGEDKLQLIDGHHRYLAAIGQGKPVRAFIGTVNKKFGPWDTMHSHQSTGKK